VELLIGTFPVSALISHWRPSLLFLSAGGLAVLFVSLNSGLALAM